MVREQKKRKRKRKGGPGSGAGRATRTPTPEVDADELGSDGDDQSESGVDKVKKEEEDLAAKGLYRAHVVEVEKIGYNESLPEKIEVEDEPLPIRPQERTLSEADQRNFMLNLGKPPSQTD